MTTAGLAIKALLDADSAIDAVRGDRMYPTDNIQMENELPYTTYHEPSVEIDHHMDGTDGVETSRVNVINYGTSYGAVRELTELCKDVLNTFKQGDITVDSETLTVQSMEVVMINDLQAEDDEAGGSDSKIHSVSLIVEVIYET